MTEAPLTGITIVDLSRVLSGPYCTMLAADMGARVIKIENVRRGDDTRAWGPPFQGSESAYYLSINRNKESVALDFRRPEGREILDRLIAGADVLVENFRPGTLDAAGLDYAVSQRETSAARLRVHFGVWPERPATGRAGLRRGRAGRGRPDEHHRRRRIAPRVRLGVAIADIASGMFAFQGLLLALLARARTGRGQWVDVSLLDSVAALLTYQASRHFATGEVPARAGNRHLTIAPYDTFETADGVLVLAVGNDTLWQRFCAARSAATTSRATRGSRPTPTASRTTRRSSRCSPRCS